MSMRLVVTLVVLLGAGCRLYFDETLLDSGSLSDVGDHGSVAFAGETHAHATNATGATQPTSVVGDNRFMLVALQIGMSCGATTIPTVSSVTYEGMPLTQASLIVGSPCSVASARSELWQLVAPPIGSANVVVTLSASATTMHTAVLQFTNVNQIGPIRAAVTMSRIRGPARVSACPALQAIWSPTSSVTEP